MFRSSRPDGPPRPPAALAAVRTTRRPMGTDVATIDAASEVEVSSTPTFSDLVTARAGNVTVSETSGNVGAGARVRIRELDSLAQENDPLLPSRASPGRSRAPTMRRSAGSSPTSAPGPCS